MGTELSKLMCEALNARIKEKNQPQPPISGLDETKPTQPHSFAPF